MRIAYLIFFILIHFCTFSQTVSVADKAKNVQNRILTQHVLISAWDDTLTERTHALFLDFLDPNRIFFSLEQSQELKKVAQEHLKNDLPNRKTTYLDEVIRIFTLEVKSTQTYFNEATISLKNPKTPKKMYSFDDFAPLSLREERRKFYLQNQLFESLFQKHEALESVTDTQIDGDLKISKTKFTDRFSEIVSIYTTDNKVIEDSYLQAIAQAADPHSLYLTAGIFQSFTDELSVEQERFGFSYGINSENKIAITKLLPGSSAWLSGKINENDVLQEVGLLEDKKWTFHTISIGLVGLKQVQDLLSAYREKEIKLVLSSATLERNEVHLYKAKILNDNELVKNVVLGNESKIGYIQLSDFYTDMTGLNAGNGCANDLAKCILKLKKDNIQGLILDLRGNGGGSLKEAIELTGIFIDYGPVLAVLERDGSVVVLKDANRGYIYDGPLLVMIDENSASASEIVAGALQDYGKALIVGQKSYGKATSQQVMSIDPLATMGGYEMGEVSEKFGYVNVTQGILYRINSQSNQMNGVVPDVSFPASFTSEEVEFESDLIGAIEAPSITKKMTYTVSSSIPKQALLEWSSNRFLAPDVEEYVKKWNSLDEKLTDEEELFLDYQAYFSWRKSIEKTVDDLKSDQQASIALTEINSNSFDRELYAKNEILRTFQNEFISDISRDFELKLTFDILQKWLLIINK